MPYEYEISVGERAWESVYIHDYSRGTRGGVRRRKLLGSEEEEVEEEAVEEVKEESQIIAFQSNALDYINQQQYHGLVRV